MSDELATSLRAWRDRLDPLDAGVSRATSRRAPGLRREEVAAEAGISVNYLTRLEQGRARAPSPSVVAGLARALRLDVAEAALLHRLTGHADTTARVAARHLTPSLRRILERFDDVPLIVYDPARVIVAANAMATAMFGEDPVGQNSARRHFLGPDWVERDQEESDRYARDIVTDLRLQLARHPDDEAVRSIVEELRAESPQFAVLWAAPPSGGIAASCKTFRHPAAGRVTVDCDTLEVAGTDLRITVWTAEPGTRDASALKLIGIAGRTTAV